MFPRYGLDKSVAATPSFFQNASRDQVFRKIENFSSCVHTVYIQYLKHTKAIINIASRNREHCAPLTPALKHSSECRASLAASTTYKDSSRNMQLATSLSKSQKEEYIEHVGPFCLDALPAFDHGVRRGYIHTYIHTHRVHWAHPPS